MTAPDHGPQTALSSGRKLFNSFIRHVTWNPEGLPAPDSFRLDRGSCHLATHFDSRGLGKGDLNAQAFDNGLMASMLAADLHQPVTRLNTRGDTFAPAVSLQMMMGGRIEWVDGRGQAHQSHRHHELWTFSGLQHWQRSSMLPSLLSQTHVTASVELLARWQEDLPDGEGRRRLQHYLDSARAASHYHAQNLPAAMGGIALRLQALLQDRTPPTLARRLQIEGLATTLPGLWLEMPEQATAGSRHRWQRAVSDTLDIIHAEYARNLSIGDLARRVGLNECYLKRAFRERTGMGIAACVRQLRLNTALALVEEGREPIHAIARHVGYTNPSHFARAFQEQHGFLPSEVHPDRSREDT